jgi:hypothetical protein
MTGWESSEDARAFIMDTKILPKRYMSHYA